MLVTDALVLCRHMARVQVIEADKLLLYMDLPPDRAEEQKTDIRAREQFEAGTDRAWSFCSAEFKRIPTRILSQALYRSRNDCTDIL